ncbi:hypothetical protein NP493_544g00018 [Ridgeia piscesae]|uniref:Fibrinogen C-terminal domain-containing protein n=1 Tax=Ridgeia piscesae TaxID=27915 RepID=A0AAD9KW47_RIDPI|nr:hypothetical protein NP493_544g00018 [Ridgeia piscesae]
MSTVLDENEICLQFHQPSRPVPAGGAAADKCNFPLVARHVSLQQQDPANIQVFHMCEFAVRGYQLPALPLRVPLLAPRVLRLPRDCADLADDGFWQSGVYSIYVRSDYRWVDVWCDLDQDSLGETASGGWTVIMHRKDGTEDFDRTWKEYEAGFGNVNGEFWFGNEIVYKMTAARSYQLKVTLVLPTNLKRFIIYDKFRLGSNISDYTLEIGLARKHQRVANVDCYTGWGYDYKGTFNTTRTGRVCADWAAAKVRG